MPSNLIRLFISANQLIKALPRGPLLRLETATLGAMKIIIVSCDLLNRYDGAR